MRRFLLPWLFPLLAFLSFGCATGYSTGLGGDRHEVHVIGSMKIIDLPLDDLTDEFHRKARELCQGGTYKIITRQIVKGGPSSPDQMVGVIECENKPSQNEKAQFAAGIDSEDYVRSVLDNGGAPIDVWVYNDHKPVTKILFYKREPYIHPVLFTYDAEKGRFVFQAIGQHQKDKFYEIKDTDEFKKSAKEWYSNLLAQIIGKNEGNIETQIKYVHELEGAFPKNEYSYNGLAWFYATCNDSKFRNARKAIELGEKSVALKKGAENVDTLAAAYAEAGDFDKAVALQEEAIKLDGKDKSEFRERLNGYKNHRTYVQQKRGGGK